MKKNKIKTIKQIEKISVNARKRKRKIVYCHGVFDLLHLGHIRHFEKSKSLGDILIVSITHEDYVNKGPNQPYFNTEQRLEMLSNLEVINYVCVSNDFDATNLIKKIKPNFYCKGVDYKDFKKDITGKINNETKAVKSFGGKFIITDEVSFSSSKLLNSENIIIDSEQNSFLNKLKKTNNFSDIENIINSFKKLRVLIVGEAIIDEYTYCDAIGKSAKDPVLVLKQLQTQKYLGGVLAIANNISDFCDNISIVSILGNKKEYKKFIDDNLSKKVKAKFFYKKNSQTITKKRYVDKNSKNKILGVYNLFDDDVSKQEITSINKYLSVNLKNFDIVFVVDYGHGFLTNSTINLINNKSKYLSINCQINSSNTGYQSIQKYNNTNLITINENELRHEMRDKRNKIEHLIKNLSYKIKFDKCVVTRGASGAIMYDKKKKIFYNCPAFAGKIVDKVGSGDTFLPFFSFSSYLKIKPNLCLLLGSIAAAQSVSSIANSVVIKKNKLLKTISHLMK